MRNDGETVPSVVSPLVILKLILSVGSDVIVNTLKKDIERDIRKNEGENMNRVGLAFSVGGNYRVGRMRIDCALSHSGRSRESETFPNEYSDYVDDSWTHFCIGLQYTI